MRHLATFRSQETAVPASRPHHEGSRADGFHAGAVALRTTLRAGSRVGARPLALDALVRHRHRELFVAPSGRIGKALQGVGSDIECGFWQ